MWLVPNNVGKNSSDVDYDKLIAFRGGSGQPGDVVGAGAVTLPGANGTWANITSGTAATQDSASTDAGRIRCRFRTANVSIQCFTD